MVAIRKPKRDADREALAQRLAVVEAERAAAMKALAAERDVAAALRAQSAALLHALRSVLSGIPHEFAKPETQAARMHARALCVEMES